MNIVNKVNMKGKNAKYSAIFIDLRPYIYREIVFTHAASCGDSTVNKGEHTSVLCPVAPAAKEHPALCISP